MATSPTDICNLALGHLGEARITSLDEDGVSARACALHYDEQRKALLRAHRWNFAQARQVLSRLAERPAFGWRYYYNLPADSLRVNEFNESEAGDVISSQFIIEGRRLLTDATEARLVYNRNIEAVSQFDSLFIEALAIKLAVKLSETIRGTTGKTAELMQAYERVVGPLARRIDANEGRRRKGMISLNSYAILARGAGSGALTSPFDMSGSLGIPDATEEEEEEPTDETEMDTWTATLAFHGEAVNLQTFGSYQPTADVELTAIEISAQTVPVGGSGITIQLVNDADASIGDPVTLASAANPPRVRVVVSEEIAADTIIRAKFTSVGSTTAGDGINVTLSFENIPDE